MMNARDSIELELGKECDIRNFSGFDESPRRGRITTVAASLSGARQYEVRFRQLDGSLAEGWFAPYELTVIG